ncbi:hypothetical protein Golax_005156, partial [Gossypium laxum]|nr:hypothetical protein [Gossypium laxum]
MMIVIQKKRSNLKRWERILMEICLLIRPRCLDLP